MAAALFYSCANTQHISPKVQADDVTVQFDDASALDLFITTP